jgi:hypothetical protein
LSGKFDAICPIKLDGYNPMTDNFIKTKMVGRLLACLNAFALVFSAFNKAAVAQTGEPAATEVIKLTKVIYPIFLIGARF